MIPRSGDGEAEQLLIIVAQSTGDRSPTVLVTEIALTDSR